MYQDSKDMDGTELCESTKQRNNPTPNTRAQPLARSPSLRDVSTTFQPLIGTSSLIVWRCPSRGLGYWNSGGMRCLSVRRWRGLCPCGLIRLCPSWWGPGPIASSGSGVCTTLCQCHRRLRLHYAVLNFLWLWATGLRWLLPVR